MHQVEAPIMPWGLAIHSLGHFMILGLSTDSAPSQEVKPKADPSQGPLLYSCEAGIFL